MKSYKIKYSYIATSPYEDAEKVKKYIEQEWTNLDIAKENLKRIYEFYNFYLLSRRISYKELKKLDKEFSIKDWYTGDSMLINLKLDNGTFNKFGIYFVGYHNKLKKIKIVEHDDEMEIIFR